MRSFLAASLEVIEVVLVAFGAVFIVRSFLLQPFLVSGLSMSPNFSDGDYLLIDELTYRFREPARGEVVVFRFRGNERATFFIKRVIALPGEKVVIQNGEVVVKNDAHPDGVTLRESYIPKGAGEGGNLEIALAQGEYFVMGDNRSFSYDSRSWGPLSRGDIVGLVRLRLWPISSAQAFVVPQYAK